MKKNKTLETIHWTARILGLQTIVFFGLSLSAGFDESGLSHYWISIFASLGVIFGIIIAYKLAFAGGLIGTLFYLAAFTIDRFNDAGYGCGYDRGSYDCDQTSFLAYFVLPALLFLIYGISQIIVAKRVRKKISQ